MPRVWKQSAGPRHVPESCIPNPDILAFEIRVNAPVLVTDSATLALSMSMSSGLFSFSYVNIESIPCTLLVLFSQCAYIS